jgi:hypothetical protein
MPISLEKDGLRLVRPFLRSNLEWAKGVQNRLGTKGGGGSTGRTNPVHHDWLEYYTLLYCGRFLGMGDQLACPGPMAEGAERALD